MTKNKVISEIFLVLVPPNIFLVPANMFLQKRHWLLLLLLLLLKTLWKGFSPMEIIHWWHVWFMKPC